MLHTSGRTVGMAYSPTARTHECSASITSRSESIKMVLSEKYREKQVAESVIDLESQPHTQDVQEQIQTPRPTSHLLSMAGVFKGAKDIARNKKQYTY